MLLVNNIYPTNERKLCVKDQFYFPIVITNCKNTDLFLIENTIKKQFPIILTSNPSGQIQNFPKCFSHIFNNSLSGLICNKKF